MIRTAFVGAPSARRLAVLSLGALLAACGGESPATDGAAGASGSSTPADIPAPVEGMNVPESVRYDAALDAYFVSNIDGNPNDKDNNGFIVRLDAANPGTPVILAKGGENGVTLHAPKGMAIAGDTLWVADIDVVHAFDKRSGALLTTVDVAPLGAIFLNDVAIGPDGAVYVTDSGIRFSATGEQSHPGTDRIFAISNGIPKIALEGDALLTSPNGIAWDAANARFILAPFGGAAISAWKPSEATVTEVASGPGGYDGVEVLADGRILVTSWADSSLNVVTDGTLTRLVGSLDAPADIGVDTRRMLVAIPRFNAARVEWVAVPAR